MYDSLENALTGRKIRPVVARRCEWREAVRVHRAQEVSEVKLQPRKSAFQATFLSQAKWGPVRWPKATQHRLAAAMLVPILLERKTEAYGKSP